MRVAVIVLALGGCQVVFPLEGVDLLAQPRVEVSTDDIVIGGVPADIDLQISGHENAIVAYRLTPTAGDVVPDGVREAALSELGLETATLSWTPPNELAIETISVASGYDAVDDTNQVAITVPLAARVGYSGGTDLLGAFDGLFAMPIAIPAPCTTFDLGVHGTSTISGNQTMVTIGLYTDAGGRPGDLLVASAPLELGQPGTPITRIADPVAMDLEPGSYWLVAGGNQTYAIETDNHQVTVAFTLTQALPLPDAFPSGGTPVTGHYAIDLTVVAR